MCSKQHAFEPTHVYANLSPHLLSQDDQKQNRNSSGRRVEVSGTAEFTLPPDEAILTIVITNKKEKAEEARASVCRRLDYVTQMLLNHGIKKSDMEVTKNMSRVNGRGWFLMEAQVDALFHSDLHKCLQLNNLFVEKLDKSAKVLPITLRHDKKQVEATRKQTCLTALANARQKAAEVCRLMGQCLGRPVYITENIIREWKGCGTPESCGLPENVDPPMPTVAEVTASGPIDIQRKMKEQSLTIKVDVTATFELRGKFEKPKK